MVGLEREETGERVINLVRGQLNWEDRGWEGLREKGRWPSSTGLYSWVCASRGVALGGRSASWKKGKKKTEKKENRTEQKKKQDQKFVRQYFEKHVR